MSYQIPQTSPEAIAVELEVLSRAPFRAILARMLGAEPTPEKVREFAEKWPDRWAQLCSIFGKLAGYSDKLEIDGSLAIAVSRLSDADLLSRIAALESETRQVVDITEQSKTNV